MYNVNIFNRDNSKKNHVNKLLECIQNSDTRFFYKNVDFRLKLFLTCSYFFLCDQHHDFRMFLILILFYKCCYWIKVSLHKWSEVKFAVFLFLNENQHDQREIKEKILFPAWDVLILRA